MQSIQRQARSPAYIKYFTVTWMECYSRSRSLDGTAPKCRKAMAFHGTIGDFATNSGRSTDDCSNCWKKFQTEVPCGGPTHIQPLLQIHCETTAIGNVLSRQVKVLGLLILIAGGS